MSFRDIFVRRSSAPGSVSADVQFRKPPSESHQSRLVKTPFFGLVRRGCEYVETDSFRLAYTCWGDRGPNVLLLSSESSSRSTTRQFQSLLSRYCRLVTLDLLGVGESEYPNEYGRRVDHEHLKRLHQRLYKSAGLEHLPGARESWDPSVDLCYLEEFADRIFQGQRFVLVACGWSCPTALRYASLVPEKLISLVLVNCNFFKMRIPDKGRYSHLPKDLLHYMSPQHEDIDPCGQCYERVACNTLLICEGREGWRLFYALYRSQCQLEVRHFGDCNPLVMKPLVVAETVLIHLIRLCGQSSLADIFLGYTNERYGDEGSVLFSLRYLFYTEDPLEGGNQQQEDYAEESLQLSSLGVTTVRNNPCSLDVVPEIPSVYSSFSINEGHTKDHIAGGPVISTIDSPSISSPYAISTLSTRSPAAPSKRFDSGRAPPSLNPVIDLPSLHDE